MTFVVEDGTGKADANSLVSLEQADAHLAATGWSQGWSLITDDAKREDWLVQSTRVVTNSFSFFGRLEFPEVQALPFPRLDLYDREGRRIVGNPILVQNATAELAFHLSENNFLVDSDLATLESIRVGPISMEISELAAITKTLPDSVIRLLSEYGTYRFGRNRMRKLLAG